MCHTPLSEIQITLWVLPIGICSRHIKGKGWKTVAQMAQTWEGRTQYCKLSRACGCLNTGCFCPFPYLLCFLKLQMAQSQGIPYLSKQNWPQKELLPNSCAIALKTENRTILSSLGLQTLFKMHSASKIPFPQWCLHRPLMHPQDFFSASSSPSCVVSYGHLWPPVWILNKNGEGGWVCSISHFPWCEHSTMKLGKIHPTGSCGA